MSFNNNIYLDIYESKNFEIFRQNVPNLLKNIGVGQRQYVCS